jgi:serine/threonine protein kinase
MEYGPMTLTDGDRLGPWLIETPLGRGELSVVYRALDSRLDRRVALKVLVDELASAEACGDKLLEAARVGATLPHRGVVPIFEGGRVSGTAYVCSRFVEGPDLGTLLARVGHLQPARALVILGQVAEALDEAHARGVIHGGVKPTNVLLRWSQVRGAEEAYVSDFAVARLLAPAAEALLGSKRGPLLYLSPEQIEGREPETRTDVYLLGCLLYECLSGLPAILGADGGPSWAHLGMSPPAPSAIRPELLAFDEVIRTAMAKAPGDRHPSCGHLIAHAREALSRPWAQPQPIRPAPRVRAPQPPSATPAPPSAPAPEPSDTIRRDKIVPSLVGAAAALALGILLLVLINSSLQTEVPEEPRPDLSEAGIEEVLRYELERNMGMFLAVQERLVDDEELGGVDGLVPIHESTEDLQLGGIYTSAATDDDVSLVAAAYPQAADADVALETERAERGGTLSRQMTPSGLVATVLSKEGEVSMVWHVDNVVFVITADDTATVRQFFDLLPRAVRLGPL